MKKLLVFAIAILGFSAVSFGQVAPATSTATSSAYATILAPIGITNSTTLKFGTIGADPSAATTVTVSNAGARSKTGNAVLYTSGQQFATGVFAITGTPNALFSITLPSGTTSLAGPTGSTAMTITGTTGWSSSLSLTAAQLSVGGTATLNLGATLNVGAAQLAGDYSGSYDVTVNYN